MKFNERILLYELQLNDTDDQVIQYIQFNKDLVVKQSIQKTAEALYTVPNTIVRLAKKLGYNSFSEMKHELKQELNDEKLEPSLQSLKLPPSIYKTHQLFDEGQIGKIVELIYQAKEVLFLGVGDTSTFSEMFSKSLTCVGISHQHFQHRHEMMYRLQHVSSKQLCIAISIRGENKDVIEAATLAKQKGATIITLTHFYKNPLASVGDINLYFWAEYEELNGYNTTDRLGLMLLIRLICEAIWKQVALN